MKIFDNFKGLAQALFEESTDSLFLLDASSKYILDANAAAQRLCGCALRELIAAPVRKMFQTDGVHGLFGLARGTRRVRRSFVQKRSLLRSVNPEIWIPVDVTLTRLNVKPISLNLLKVRDALTNAFREPNAVQRLRLMVFESSACFWSAEISNRHEIRFHYSQSVIERITGRPASFFGTSLDRWREIIHPDDQTHWQKVWDRLRCGESADFEYRIIWPDDSVHWVCENVRVGARSENQPLCLFGIVSDITATKQIEEWPSDLNRLVDHISHTV